MSAITIEDCLVAYLTGTPTNQPVADFQTLISHVYPYAGSEKYARPKVTYYRVDTQRQFGNDGPTYTPRSRIQFDIWADDYLTVKTVAIYLRKALDGMRDTLSGIVIQGIHCLDERDTPVTNIQPGKEKPIQRVTLDCYVDYVDL